MSFFTGFLSTLLGAYCPICNARVWQFRELCYECDQQSARFENPRHFRTWLESEAGDLTVLSACEYTGWAETLLLRQKQVRDPEITMWMAGLLRPLLHTLLTREPDAVLITVPSHRFRREAHLVDYLFSHLVQESKLLDHSPLLTRRFRFLNRSQKAQGMEGRMNLSGEYRARSPLHDLTTKHIIILDDVLTTGATLVDCHEALCDAGFEGRISALTFAVRIKKGRSGTSSPYVRETICVTPLKT